MKNRNLHIIIYSELLTYGGGRETWLSYFLPNILNKGVFDKVYIYSLKPRKYHESLINSFRLFWSFASKLEFITVDLKSPEKNHVVNNFYKFSIGCFKKLKENIRSGDLVVLVGSGMEAFIGILIKTLYGKKVELFTWIRSITLGELKTRKNIVFVKFASLLENILLRISDKIITNGYDTYDYYLEKFPKQCNRIVLIENAVDWARFSKLSLPDFRNKPIKICYIGRINEAKGFSYFIDSVRIFEKKYKNLLECVEFHVWGWGGGKINLNELIIYHGEFEREYIYKILDSCHAVVFLNRTGVSGGISHTLLEAMAAGRLLIAWDNFIHSQIINNNNNGILIPEGNVEKLADSYFNILIQPSDLTLKICMNAREKAKEFSIDRHICKFLNLI